MYNRTGNNQHKIGVQMTGYAHQLKGMHNDLTAKLWIKGGVIELPDNLEEVVGKDKWYVFIPDTIEVFDEAKIVKEIIYLT
jgi:hypothetical protein